jgi:predicted nucleic acid-binding protein
MANFFWRAVMRGRMAVAKAEADLADLRLLDLVTVASAGLCEQALRWSVEFEHPAYDMVYAALAADLGIEVVTADERFVRAVGSRLPVRWLGTAIV